MRQSDIGEAPNLADFAARILDRSDKRVRDALSSPKVPETDVPVYIPRFISDMQPAERLVVWEELLDFNSSLPADSTKQEYILTWLSNYRQIDRPNEEPNEKEAALPIPRR